MFGAGVGSRALRDYATHSSPCPFYRREAPARSLTFTPVEGPPVVDRVSRLSYLSSLSLYIFDLQATEQSQPSAEQTLISSVFLLMFHVRGRGSQKGLSGL